MSDNDNHFVKHDYVKGKCSCFYLHISVYILTIRIEDSVVLSVIPCILI